MLLHPGDVRIRLLDDQARRYAELRIVADEPSTMSMSRVRM